MTAWTPDPATRERARLTTFMREVGVTSFEDLHRRSISDIAWFTDAVLRFLELPFDRPYQDVVDLTRGKPWARWCVGGQLNIAAALDQAAARAPDRGAVIWEGEDGATRSLTYRELAAAVERCAAGLRSLGLGAGQAIGIHLPMMPETAVTLLATARIGAVAVPLFSGYGPAAIAARLQDVGARALVTSNGFPRRGHAVPALAAATTAVGQCPTVQHLIVVERLPEPDRQGESRSVVSWRELDRRGDDGDAAARRREITDAEHPLIALYTSGTTGRPKGILHTHCGFPVKAAQDMTFGTDVGPDDRVAWVTDIGWMMGPWLIYGCIIRGATMVLYDGAPDFPSPDRLWDVCARHGVTVLGISPTLVRGLMAADALPGSHDLGRLRILASTGEPWNPDPWWWLFEHVGRGRIPLINYSGGTECSGGILMSNPLLPIEPCAFSAPCPGIAADVVDDSGKPLRGAVGELVIREPWIGMARGFWNDPQRYLETYWSRWPGLWVHGDWARVDPDGQWHILGRSDDTLKVAGKRVGPAEVESVLVAHPSVAEAAAVGVPDEKKGTVLVVLCVLRAASPDPRSLEGELSNLVAEQLGKALRPGRIHFVSALPRTRNAKVMRRVIRAAYLGEDPGDVTALENPASLAEIRAAAT